MSLRFRHFVWKILIYREILCEKNWINTFILNWKEIISFIHSLRDIQWFWGESKKKMLKLERKQNLTFLRKDENFDDLQSPTICFTFFPRSFLFHKLILEICYFVIDKKDWFFWPKNVSFFIAFFLLSSSEKYFWNWIIFSIRNWKVFSKDQILKTRVIS